MIQNKLNQSLLIITKNGNNNTKSKKITPKVTIIRNVFITSYYSITTFGNKDVMIIGSKQQKETEKSRRGYYG